MNQHALRRAEIAVFPEGAAIAQAGVQPGAVDRERKAGRLRAPPRLQRLLQAAEACKSGLVSKGASLVRLQFAGQHFVVVAVEDDVLPHDGKITEHGRGPFEAVRRRPRGLLESHLRQ